MPKIKPKTLEGTDYATLWETEYKPEILKYYEVPLPVVAAALGSSVNRIQEQLRSGLYPYGVARPCTGGSYRYEVMPLRLIAYVEGKMNTVNLISNGSTY